MKVKIFKFVILLFLICCSQAHATYGFVSESSFVPKDAISNLDNLSCGVLMSDAFAVGVVRSIVGKTKGSSYRVEDKALDMVSECYLPYRSVFFSRDVQEKMKKDSAWILIWKVIVAMSQDDIYKKAIGLMQQAVESDPNDRDYKKILSNLITLSELYELNRLMLIFCEECDYDNLFEKAP